MSNIQFYTVHLLVVSDSAYLKNSASGIENGAILGPKMRFLPNRLLNFHDIDNRSTPKDAPCKAAYLIYQMLNYLTNINGHNWTVRLKNRRLLTWYGRCHAVL